MPDRTNASTDLSIPVVAVPEGGYVFKAGDAADSFFIVSTGQVELLRRGETRGRLALLDAGDVCGEDAAFEGHVRTHDARAITSTTLLEVKATSFTEAVKVRPELAGVLIGRTAANLLQARAACLAVAQAGTGASGPRLIHTESGSQFRLPDGETSVVGRSDPRTSFKPDVELSVVDTHRSLSRRHASIRRSAAGAFEISEEPRVANGTFVNGVRLSAGVSTPLKDGDEVSFGLIRTVFRTT